MPPDFSLQIFGPSNGHTAGLLSFLKHARHQSIHTIRNGVISSPHSPIYVMGNQSADLDSIISAIVYSYFFSRIDVKDNKRGYVPLVNLPDVPSGPELRRLRPEFACALELSISSKGSASAPQENEKKEKDGDSIVKMLKEHIVTVADLRRELVSSGAAENNDDMKKDQKSKLEIDCVLVDWNSLPHRTSKDGKELMGKGSIDGLDHLVNFSVIGSIDHHADEHFVPASEDLPNGNPRVILLGPGSCTSLVIREIQQRGLWPNSSTSVAGGTRSESKHEEHGEIELAKLALAAILIDTNNLTAEGKVTSIDRDAVSFLTERISSSSAGGGKNWDRGNFFEQIQYAKAHSLDWLTIEEILGRDYKDWSEFSPSGDKRVIGIASVVRPLSWITSKARDQKEEGHNESDNNSLELFLDELKNFAIGKKLDVVSAMTAFESGDNERRFARELLVWDINADCDEKLELFANSAKEQLGLQKWNDFPAEGKQKEGTGRLYIWQQGDVAKSRKQVAPLLRDVFTS